MSMRYAAIADIHGNMRAFSAILADAEKQNIDAFILLGDYCAGFPYGNDVVDTIRGMDNVYAIKGNGDDYMLNLRGQDQSGWTDGQFQTLYWTFRNLSAENLDYLASLPDVLNLQDLISCTHNPMDFFAGACLDSLWSSDYTYKSRNGDLSFNAYISAFEAACASDEILAALLSSKPAQVFLSGHNHMQYTLNVGGKYIINPGSCGCPLDGDSPCAPYTIVETQGEEYLVSGRRVAYDAAAAIRDLRASPLYLAAPVWSEIIIGEMEASKALTAFFFRHAEAYAGKIGDSVRPFSCETFAAAYKSWISGSLYGEEQ